ncbi:hypothetical protein [Tropicimonas sp. IMCC34043]|uniref:hypothetical protein n=1 Tax=Tropicimonas sp. IMCC34043 TaxID=2248760 RepID=UPI000E2320ED|nr:hypothetical protein [Tropicimonas sp. IMCC34043]
MVRRGLMAFGVAAAVSVTLALSAGQALARNGNAPRLLTRGTPDNIEVFAGGGAQQGSVFFCNAARYADGPLNARMTDRLVIIRPLGPSPTVATRYSVSFALVGRDVRSPWGGGVLVTPRRVGMNRSVAHSLSFCNVPNATSSSS